MRFYHHFSLNMPHDDDTRCRRFDKPGVKRRRHIMSSVMERDIHPWSWSDCSRYYVSDFLEYVFVVKNWKDQKLLFVI